ncbi:glycosyltransferase family 2 protein [Escherichia coli]|uniref:glycosyltransferase family 2 protein n=2 Tax=Escherichia coli TaxID=562 RepID=UPI00069A43B7|nr:glycosyltransferase family A protein [Escherichia coli]EHY6417548.1 glycosyltransferase family 2 protein [Escherichia coli]CTS18983.1 WbdN [Escherichia coli]HCQ6572579.1 glycosyltransferase family 2 protein [Escherichia coli]
MLISIIITTRNSSSYIKKTLDAIVSQTFQSYEVLVIDDASDDISELTKIIENYSAIITIRVIKQSTKTNASVTRNIGIKNSIGEIICFLDADDIWRENKLEVVAKVFDDFKNESTIVFHQSLRGTLNDINAGKGKIVPETGPATNNIVDYLMNEHGVIQTSTISINRKSAEILVFDESLPRHQDIQFCFDAYKNKVNFIFVEQILSNWIILDRASNAHTKGANVDFCLGWINKNRSVLTDKNIVNYLSNVLFLIAIKEKAFFRTIPISVALLGCNSLIAWRKFFILVFSRVLKVFKRKS